VRTIEHSITNRDKVIPDSPSKFNPRPRPDKEKLQNTVADFLTANGFYEMMSNSLTKSDYYTKYTSFEAAQEVKIINPLSSDLNAMRRTLLFGGLEAVSRNINRQMPDLKLYEFGNTYLFHPDKADKGMKAYSESARLALFITGAANEQSWAKPQGATNFFLLKGYVEKILERCGINIYNLATDETPADIFADGVSLRWKNRSLVTFGTLSKTVRTTFDIKQEVYAAEFRWDVLIEAQQADKVLFADLPKYPEVRRDLALVIDESITFAQLRAIALKTEKQGLKHVGLFDVYYGDKLPDGKKQYALSFTIQSTERTLTDEEIDRLMSNLLKNFEKEAGAGLR
jgi:phenylalanyl-tRNA synthetase beta chain